MQQNFQKSPKLPLVSVIVPAYNAEPFIEATLKSVLAQTYQAIEVLVIDDGSQDQTAEIVTAIAQKDSRVTLLKQSNAGVAAARNLGIQKSKGEFIAPIDADDIWYPTNLEKQVQCMVKGDPSIGVVYSWSVDIDEAGLLTGGFRAFTIEGEVYGTLVSHNFLGNASASMIRRTCLEKVGLYDSSYKEKNAQGCEDWDLYLRLAEHYQFGVIPEFLIGYRKVYTSMSSNYAAMAKSHTLMLEALRQRNPEVPEILHRLSGSNFLIYLAHQSSRSGRDRTTLFWLYQALKAEWISPFLRYGFYRLLVKSLLNLTIQFFKSPVSSPTSDQLQEIQPAKNYPTDLDNLRQTRQMNITLMVVIGNLFHAFTSFAIARKNTKKMNKFNPCTIQLGDPE